MAPKKDEAATGPDKPLSVGSPHGATAPVDVAASAAAAESLAPPTTTETAPPPSGADFDITLKNNDNPDQKQVVVAHGIDGGLAAQAAMRSHPGWTADHSQTHEHAETHPTDTTHGER
jgi:hypothetical protein